MELGNVLIKEMEKVCVQASQERKRVVFKDCEGEHTFALLTNDQIKLLNFLQKNNLLDYEVNWEIVEEKNWEKV